MIPIIGAIASALTSGGDYSQTEKESRSFEYAEVVKTAEGVVDIEPVYTKVTEIYIYPCRGVPGIKVREAKITPTGLENDRKWFCIKRTEDEKLKFKPGKLWQGIAKAKELGRMKCRFEGDWLIFSHPEMESDLKVPMHGDLSSKETHEFLNYDQITLKCYSEGEEAEKWFTKATGKPLILVRCDDTPPIAVHDVKKPLAKEYTEKKYLMNSGHVDGAIHFISEASLNALADAVEDKTVPVESAQFKPNFVVLGNDPYEEDKMKEMIIGEESKTGVTLTITKQCVRCKNTAYNYSNGKFHDYMEPFTTLRKLRALDTGIEAPFGMYCSPDTEGTIRVGDKVVYTKGLR